jgi:hypothetical protein
MICNLPDVWNLDGEVADHREEAVPVSSEAKLGTAMRHD